MRRAVELELARCSDRGKLAFSELFPNAPLSAVGLNFDSPADAIQDTQDVNLVEVTRDDTDKVIIFFLSQVSQDAKEGSDAFLIEGRWGRKRVLKSGAPMFRGTSPEDILRDLTHSSVWVEKCKVSKERDFTPILRRGEQSHIAAVLCSLDENGRIGRYRLLANINEPRVTIGDFTQGFEYMISATILSPAIFSSIAVSGSWTHETSGGTPIPIIYLVTSCRGRVILNTCWRSRLLR
jgi:hypothetical protein